MLEDKRQNEIIRIQKKRNNFVMMDKGFLEDDRLSYKAKGILAYLLSKPDNWKVIVKDLVNHAKDGKKAIYSGLKELKEYGYYRKVPVRDEKGHRISYWESVIFECPEEFTGQLKGNNTNSLLSQKGEVEKNRINSTSSLLTPFVHIEDVYIENVDIQNRQHNNNNNSNINQSYNHVKSKSSQTENKKMTNDMTNDFDIQQRELSEQQKRTSQTTAHESTGLQSPPQDNHSIDNDYITYRELIQENINYNYFSDYREPDIGLVDELINCMLDVILTKGETVKINGEEKNRNLVISQYLKLNMMDIEHILYKYRDQRQKITHLHSYLKTMLYTVKQESGHYYTNAVRADGVV